MIRFLVRILLTAATFAFILPLIKGIDFHGNFLIAVVAALIFGLIGWLVDLIAVTLTAVFAISTLGLGLLILVPLWIFGFWLLPAVTLKVVADLMPTQFSVGGWIPAIEGGLVLLIVGALTSFLQGRKKE